MIIILRVPILRIFTVYFDLELIQNFDFDLRFQVILYEVRESFVRLYEEIRTWVYYNQYIRTNNVLSYIHVACISINTFLEQPQ